ncbi:MAG: undecaprenyldiphospho-muramoylpentapeptide beta-N-acetylglucosaminyltransferase [Bacteroidales bacterium]|jgi:UDP-N-acetylglucosamine--N-acetylmuramyl-(pentapeptide) pyrophosphoryl-undecaprenol N-acetylglucosamine transferase|nr:undecaprenyldiphospho-muramoylpentapeptide beta-N-acetylglucosaminyltransferase [Bacteroidales bacterium]
MTEAGRNIKVIISGGGTGGHLFPAIAIANALKRLDTEVDILFVGASGRMEMQKVPEAGYAIEGLEIAGFVRSISLKNVAVLGKLFRSMLKAKKIIRRFNPDVVVGVGGYASGPVLKQAQRMGIPTLIQEQNSYAGVTNKLLARKAGRICVAYEGMEKYFPADKILLTGNPVRHLFNNLSALRREALEHFSLDAGKQVILVLGGSLGAGTINTSVGSGIDLIEEEGVQMIWQTGSHYYDRMREMTEAARAGCVRVAGFINRMDLAYAAADIIISRAGAGTISELALVGKPVILVPSPNVAEDHQTHNAMALVNRVAALLVTDAEAPSILMTTALKLVKDMSRRTILSENIKRMAIGNADEIIAREVLNLVKR